MTEKWVYLFAEGDGSMRNLLGGKGAGLCAMTQAGLPVPPGFVITTKACNAYFENDQAFPAEMWEQTLAALKNVEEQTGKKFGDPSNPLLVSVRSGARVSMPGMMDTVLNVGLNPETLEGLAKLTSNERFAWDAYRRFIQMFANIVKEQDRTQFEEILDEYKAKTEGKQDVDLTTDMLKAIVGEFKALYEKLLGEQFPEDPYEQLEAAVRAVFDSWFGARAYAYREREKIAHDWGTAVNVQTMVFGNMGENSGTGVAFTRNPSTGERKMYGEYLLDAQGEDVVAGTRTPSELQVMAEEMPSVYEEFTNIAARLEKTYRNMQDMEFTIERGKLWMLQTRTGKRTATAAAKIAVDMVNEGVISKEEALMRVTPEQVSQLLHPTFDPEAVEEAKTSGGFLARGLNASPGAATGMVAFDADLAEKWGKAGENVIMVRPETSPDDVHGMGASRGILTQHGGMTSHAAVVARSWGTPCVAGCESISINLQTRQFTANGQTIKEGDYISIDGTTGEVFAGQMPTVEPNYEEQTDLITLLSWADEIRRLGVFTNADYPRDAALARQFGAEGIGLCRTEHMFFEEERRPSVVAMIMAKTQEERQKHLDALLPFQREDFEGLLEAMEGLPVIIRLIDPPMHEFLPPREELLEEVATLRATGENPELLAEREEILRVVNEMWEVNPMLGLRGCRAGLMYEGLTEMQVRAVFEAACNVAAKGVDVHPEIMIPLVGHVNELKVELDKLVQVAEQVMAEKGIEVDHKFGTMIEVPRAALTADEIAEYAEFFSFGTNDLTQMTFGISRDDAEGKFLMQYVDRKLLPANPFQTLDQKGVGKLVDMAVKLGRQTRPDIELGICGEHGGDPDSIHFFHKVGLKYVSASPYRVPVARLAAAQVVLEEKGIA